MSSTVSGSSTVNGLYSNANQISGLVSGLDTESMIESLVSGYNTKITSLQQEIVMKQWQQEGYRDVISQLMEFTSKYTNFSNSSTNLLSSAFFGSGTTTSATGAMSDKVSVSGTTSSDIQITNVLSTATTARYTDTTLQSAASSDQISGEDVNLATATTQGTLSGSMTFGYGGSSTVSISFSSSDVIEGDTASAQGQALADIINSKLADATLTVGSSTNSANHYMQAQWDDASQSIVMVDMQPDAGNGVTVKSASSAVTDALGLEFEDEDGNSVSSISFSSAKDDLTKQVSGWDTISGQDIRFEYNGSTRTITIPSMEDVQYDGNGNVTSVTFGGNTYTDMNAANEALVTAINDDLTAAFNGELTISNTGSGGSLNLQIDIAGSGNNTLKVWSSVGDALGLGETSTNYVNTSTEIGDILDKLGTSIEFGSNQTISGGTVPSLTGDVAYMVASGNVTYNSTTGESYDSDGDKVVGVTDGAGNEFFVKVDDDDKARVGAVVEINGVEVGVYDSSSSLSTIISDINNSSCGVNATFSTLTNSMIFTATESGTNSQISIGGGLGSALFGTVDENASNYTAGQNAVVVATVNGEEVIMERTSNTVEIDGLKITVNETFNNTTESGDVISSVSDYNSMDPDDALVNEGVVSFKEETDVTEIAAVITQMVADYNTLLNNIKSYFTEVPLTTTTGESYKPLTDEDASTMSESAIESYESKAKTGILYGDSNMRNLYNSLSSAFSAGGAFGSTLSKMGFDVTYGTFSGSGDSEVVSLDQDKLIDMLTNNMDEVKSAFISTASSTGTVGVMSSLKSTMEQYGQTSGSSKGILVDAAGSELSSLSLLSNSMQTKIDSINDMIAKWEEKLSDKVTYYTSKFSSLEVLMSNANSQISSLQGLSGY